MTDPTTPRRDPAGATLGATLAALFAGVGTWLATLGGWGIPAAILAALFAAGSLAGLAESLRRVPRDARGIAHR